MTEFNIPTTGELTKKDWEEVERRGRWHCSYDQVALKDFLNVDNMDLIVSTREQTSIAMGWIVRFSAKDFFEETGFKIVRTADFGHDGEYSPSFKNIEYEQNKYKNCLYDGYFLMEKDGQRYIYKAEPAHEGSNFYIFAHRDANPDAGKIIEDLFAYVKKHNYLRGKKIDPRCNIIPLDRKYCWDDLILSDERKDDIRRNLSNLIDYIDIYKKNNLQIKRGLIFHGSPGTGKTLLGKILCSTVDWTFVWVTPKFLQDSRDVSKVVNICRDLSPSILFLEDMDLYGGTRDQNGNLGVLGELMNSLDGIQENNNIITIATTNDKEKLEKALLNRPGRFDRVIEFLEPDETSRLHMLKLFTKEVLLHDSIDLSKLASYLKNLTGAQIKELINLSILYAIDEKSFDNDKKIMLKPVHIKEALPSMQKKDYNSVGFASSDDDDDDLPWDIRPSIGYGD